MKSRWPLALSVLLLLPPTANARDDESRRTIRVRDDAGNSRIVIRDADDLVEFDEEDLEEMLEGIEDLGPVIEDAVRSAMEQLDRANFRLERDWDGDSYFVGDRMSDDEWEAWSEDFAERFESMDEEIREQVERATRAAARSERWQRRYEDEDREGAEAEIRDLKRQVRELKAELEKLRQDG